MTARPIPVRSALAAVGVWLALGAAVAGCGHAAPASAPATTGPPPPTSPLTVPPTTRPTTTVPPTTLWKPSAPRASPDEAAATLVNAWADRDRATAGSVATPEAVATLFAVPYPGPGLAISRGCSTAFPPVKCTYGPPGGASPSDAIYEISVSQAPGGWYVSSVQVLG